MTLRNIVSLFVLMNIRHAQRLIFSFRRSSAILRRLAEGSLHSLASPRIRERFFALLRMTRFILKLLIFLGWGTDWILGKAASLLLALAQFIARKTSLFLRKQESKNDLSSPCRWGSKNTYIDSRLRVNDIFWIPAFTVMTRPLRKVFFWRYLPYKQKQYYYLTLACVVVTALVFAVNSLLFASKASAAWYNNNWKFRQAITITNTGTAQTNIQYVLNIDTATMITANKLQANCADLRFTNASGKVLSYYLAAGCGSRATAVWVMLDSLTTNATTFYVYYGNPNATSNSKSGPFTALSNLGGYWTLSEGVGSAAYDASGNSINGIASIGPTGTQTATTTAWSNGLVGKIGQSLNFDGTDDVITFLSSTLDYVNGIISQGVKINGTQTANGASNSLSFPRGTQVSGNRYSTIDGNQGSISFWFKPDFAYDNSLDHVLLEFPSLLKLTYNNSTDAFDFGYWNGSNYTTVKVSSAGQTFASGSWNYIALTWDVDNSPYLQIKVNNSAIVQYTTGAITAQTPQTINYIGADQNNQNSGQGTFDDFIITAYPLRQTEGGTVTTSGTTITGTSTSFLTLSQNGYQDSLTLSGDNAVYTVNTVASATSLTTVNAPATHASATNFQAGQMVSLYNGGVGSAATLIEPNQRLFYATMNDNGNLLPSNSSGGTSMDWTTGQLASNGTMETASSGTPTSWSGSGSPTLADGETANILADTRTQKITVTAASKGITLTSNLTVSAGQRYKISAYVKSDGTNRGNLRVRNVTASTNLATLGTTSSAWQLLTTDVTIPSGWYDFP